MSLVLAIVMIGNALRPENGVAMRSETRDHQSMGFFVVQPEASGRPTSDRRSRAQVSCSFDTWLGDDVVRAHPIILVTTPLKEALEGVSGATGFSLQPAEVTASPFFQRHNPGRTLPRFWSVSVHGRAGVDDLGLAPDGSMVASGRLVEVLGGFAMRHGTLSQFCAPADQPQPAGAAAR